MNSRIPRYVSITYGGRFLSKKVVEKLLIFMFGANFGEI